MRFPFFSYLLFSSVIVFAEADRPNVLMISIDDLNDWVGCMKGHPDVKTPNIDRLAERGILFENAHCPAPMCGPSRAAIMTGVSPSSSGIYGQISDNDLSKPFNGDIVYMSNWFGQNGYHTLCKGKVFHQNAPEGAFSENGGRVPGFGPMHPEGRLKWNKKNTGTDWAAFPDRDEEMIDHATAEWAVEKLKSKSLSCEKKPFFMAVGFIRPHTPFYAPQKWFDLYPVESLTLPPYKADDFDDLPEMSFELTYMRQMPSTEWAIRSGEWKHIVQAYLACISFVDHCVGMVLDALEESDHADNTIVVLWSDHGYHLGEKNRVSKHSLWERTARVPLIFSIPDMPGGRKTDGAASLLDLYPTLLELCDLPENPQNEGVSLVPLIEDPLTEWDHMALITYGKGNHSVRSRYFRYIAYENGDEELYDMRKDPNEWINLASYPKYARVKRHMSSALPEDEVPWSKWSFYPVANDYWDRRAKERR